MKKIKNALGNISKAIREKPGWFVMFLCVAALVATMIALTATGQLPAGEFSKFVWTFTGVYVGLGIGSSYQKGKSAEKGE